MKQQIRGSWYCKSGYYYVRITYYIGDKRKQKNYPTGIKVDERKKKRLNREADQKVAEILAGFVVPGSKQERNEQPFADLVAEWLEHQKVSKPASTYAGYQYAAQDVMLYFRDINPIKTTELTGSMVEKYQSWERARRCSRRAKIATLRSERNDQSGRGEIANSPVGNFLV